MNSVITKLNVLLHLARNCGDPGVPADGQRLGLLFHYTSNVSFTCDSCYKLVGVPYRICMADGRWSDQQPICKSK